MENTNTSHPGRVHLQRRNPNLVLVKEAGDIINIKGKGKIEKDPKVIVTIGHQTAEVKRGHRGQIAILTEKGLRILQMMLKKVLKK